MKSISFRRYTPLLACLLVAAGSATGARAAGPETELKDEKGATIVRYIVDAPPNLAPAGTTDPTKQVGLFLVFPEHEHPTGDELKTVNDTLERLKIRGDYVLIAAHAQNPRGFFGEADFAPLEKLIAWAKQTYPVNPRRVYMFGRGEGAHISGEFAAFHPDLVCASIFYSWGFRRVPPAVNDAQHTAPEYYLNLGLKEIPTHLKEVPDTYGRVKSKGYRAIFRKWPGIGANTYYPPSNDDALGWIVRYRNGNVPPTQEELNLLKPFTKHDLHVTSVESLRPLVLVGGPPAGVVVRQLLLSHDARVRAAAAEACGQARFGEETMTALGHHLWDRSPMVRKAAMASLASAANWRSEAAQQALIRYATDERLKAPARVDAVNALGQAVKLQVNGAQQDPPMFKALISLLDDDDERVRTASFAILSPLRPSDYRPADGETGRPAAIAGWQQWLGGITAQEEAFSKPQPPPQ